VCLLPHDRSVCPAELNQPCRRGRQSSAVWCALDNHSRPRHGSVRATEPGQEGGVGWGGGGGVRGELTPGFSARWVRTAALYIGVHCSVVVLRLCLQPIPPLIQEACSLDDCVACAKVGTCVKRDVGCPCEEYSGSPSASTPFLPSCRQCVSVQGCAFCPTTGECTASASVANGTCQGGQWMDSVMPLAAEHCGSWCTQPEVGLVRERLYVSLPAPVCDCAFNGLSHPRAYRGA
jgi:hypothetical protein